MQNSMANFPDLDMKEIAKRCLDLIELNKNKRDMTISQINLQIQKVEMTLPPDVLDTNCGVFLRDHSGDLNKLCMKIAEKKITSKMPRQMAMNTPPKMKKLDSEKFMLQRPRLQKAQSFAEKPAN